MDTNCDQAHIRKVGNGFIVTVHAKQQSKGDLASLFGHSPAPVKELVFETMLDACIFLMHWFEEKPIKDLLTAEEKHDYDEQKYMEKMRKDINKYKANFENVFGPKKYN